VRRFHLTDATITRDSVSVEGDAWSISVQEPRTVRLFEVADPGVERCLLTYRASLRSEDLAGRAYLEMWCRFPGRGEYFSRGLNQPLEGTTGWASYETPFRLRKGQRPDLIKLDLTVEGRGKVWIKDVELLKTPG
jgi:hypothetical protein